MRQVERNRGNKNESQFSSEHCSERGNFGAITHYV
jgi:hypothetical protein